MLDNDEETKDGKLSALAEAVRDEDGDVGHRRRAVHPPKENRGGAGVGSEGCSLQCGRRAGCLQRQ